jgi:hypothetical protein
VTRAVLIAILSVVLIVIIAIGALSVAFATGVGGGGNMISQTRAVSGYDRISLEGTGEVIVVQGSQESVRVEAPENLINNVKTEVQNGTLIFSQDSGRFWFNFGAWGNVKYYVTVTNVSGLTIAGSGSLQAADLKAKSLDVTVSGSGSGNIGVRADSLVVQISGSGSLKLTGAATQETVTISGSGSYNGRDLQADQAKVTVTGSGSGNVRVATSLDAVVAGSGSVSYWGNPKVSQTVTGSGSVNKAGN